MGCIGANDYKEPGIICVHGSQDPISNTDHANSVNRNNGLGNCVCYPINSMVIGKDIKDGDRQTTGIGSDGDPCPTLQAAHHHAVAIAEYTIGRKIENGGNGTGAKEEVAYTQNCTGVMSVCQNAIVPPLELCKQISGQLSELLNYTVVCKYDESENLFYAQIFNVVESKVFDYSNANYGRLGAFCIPVMFTPEQTQDCFPGRYDAEEAAPEIKAEKGVGVRVRARVRVRRGRGRG